MEKGFIKVLRPEREPQKRARENSKQKKSRTRNNPRLGKRRTGDGIMMDTGVVPLDEEEAAKRKRRYVFCRGCCARKA